MMRDRRSKTAFFDKVRPICKIDVCAQLIIARSPTRYRPLNYTAKRLAWFCRARELGVKRLQSANRGCDAVERVRAVLGSVRAGSLRLVKRYN